jgi:hypothetical protein
VLTLVLAAQSSHLGVFTAALAFGFAVGILGHLSSSRVLIVTGILIIGLASAYFAFVLRPSS